MCINSTEDIQHYEKVEDTKEVEKYFPGLLAFIDFTEQ